MLMESTEQLPAAFSEPTRLHKLLPLFLDYFASLCKARCGYMFFHDTDSDEFYLCGCKQMGIFELEHETISLDAAVRERLERLNGPVLLKQVPDGSSLKETVNEIDRQLTVLTRGAGVMQTVQTAALIPLKAGGTLVALVGLFPEVRVTLESLPLLKRLAEHGGQAIAHAQAYEQQLEEERQLLELLSEIIDERTFQRAGHSRDVAHCCRMIAEQMGLGEEVVRRVEWAGYLHDIGRLAVDEELLRRQDRFSKEELERFREQMIEGLSLLEDRPALKPFAHLIRCYTEWYNGSGYPQGLKGDEIPIESRILAVAHRFCITLAARPYRRSMAAFSEGLGRLKSEAGTQLDPEVVEAFLQLFKEAAEGV